MKHFNDNREIKMNNRSGDNKEKLLNIFKTKNLKAWRDLYNQSSIQETKDRIVSLQKLENHGGWCFKCGVAWIQIKKENLFYNVEIWNPGCWCFFRCPLCGRSNHYEIESGYLKKRNYKCRCRFKLVRNGINFWGQKYERENFDYLNKIRIENNIYYQEFDGTMVIERSKD